MTDQRVAMLSRNLRTQGYVDNDPDATLAAIRLIALAEALEAQQPCVDQVFLAGSRSPSANRQFDGKT